MSDRATWTKYGNKQSHVVVVEGDPPLFNQYGVTAVNGDICPNVKSEAAAQFVNWLISDEGQEAIGAYRIGEMQVFFPNAERAVN
jgi:tungstate transport system substrate-binding protein